MSDPISNKYTHNGTSFRYKGYWCANGTTYGYRFGDNKRLLIRDLLEICKGNVLKGSSGVYCVWERLLDVDFMVKEGQVHCIK